MSRSQTTNLLPQPCPNIQAFSDLEKEKKLGLNKHPDLNEKELRRLC